MDKTFRELQQTFRRVNPHVLRLWRWHLGWVMSVFPPVSGKIAVLTHTGRKSGLRRQTPLNYAVIDGDVWLTGNRAAEWVRNVQADPDVEVWLPLRRPRTGVVVEHLPVDDAHVEQYRRVLLASGFAATAFAGIRPRRASVAELLAHGAEYHLLRMHRGEPVPRSRRATA